MPLCGRLVEVPRRSEIFLPVDEALVVECYQRYLRFQARAGLSPALQSRGEVK